MRSVLKWNECMRYNDNQKFCLILNNCIQCIILKSARLSMHARIKLLYINTLVGHEQCSRLFSGSLLLTQW